MVKVGDWAVERHNGYNTFMKRMRSIIATVLHVEKKKREHKQQVYKSVLGHDP